MRKTCEFISSGCANGERKFHLGNWLKSVSTFSTSYCVQSWKGLSAAYFQPERVFTFLYYLIVGFSTPSQTCKWTLSKYDTEFCMNTRQRWHRPVRRNSANKICNGIKGSKLSQFFLTATFNGDRQCNEGCFIDQKANVALLIVSVVELWPWKVLSCMHTASDTRLKNFNALPDFF